MDDKDVLDTRLREKIWTRAYLYALNRMPVSSAASQADDAVARFAQALRRIPKRLSSVEELFPSNEHEAD